MSQMHQAVQRHDCYCKENFPEGLLKIHALHSAEHTQYFWQTLAAYIEDELIMLLSFDLKEKQVLLLLSNQMVQICDDLFKFRGQAMNNDNTAKGTPACYAWVTFQALDCMEGYLRDQFRHHPAINSTFIHFLTHTMVDLLWD
jgi:hypothetical protein